MIGAIGSTRKQRQAGMTLIELMLAIAILAVGLVGVLALILTAISGNNRNKMDSSATLLGQMVMEKIAAQPALAGAGFDIEDCKPVTPNTWHIATASAAAPGAGAGRVAATGDIDWTATYASVTADYKMKYVTCGANDQQATYEVRWNIQTVNGFSKMITVGARPLGAQSSGGASIRMFAPPVLLRTIVSN